MSRKSILFVALCFLSVQLVRAQEKEEVFDNAKVEVPATYPGGEQALMADVASLVTYPEAALARNVQGVCLLGVKVDKDGFVSDARVRKALSRECDAEAIRVVKLLKRFTPARDKGRRVAVWFTVPVRFLIRDLAR